MTGLEKFIKSLTELRETIRRSKGLNESLESRFRAIDKKFNNLESLLEEDAVRQEVEKALLSIPENVQENLDSGNFSEYFRKNKNEFIAAEMRLHKTLKIKRKSLERIVEECVSEYDKITEDQIEILSSFPGDIPGMIEFIKSRIQLVKDGMVESQDTSRKEKKKHRDNIFGRVWMGTVGTTLALGDVLLALPTYGLSAEISVASMTIGVTTVSAAVHNRPVKIKLRK